MMKNIYSRVPVNKTASLVINQSGCTGAETLTLEQERENLVSKVKLLQEHRSTVPKKSARYKELGAQMNIVNLQINALRAKKKCPGIERYLLDVIQEEVTKFQWKRFMDKAADRMRADTNERGWE